MIHVITILFFWSIGLQKNVFVFFWNFWRPLNLKMRIPKTNKFENWNFENLKVGECIFWTPENLKMGFLKSGIENESFGGLKCLKTWSLVFGLLVFVVCFWSLGLSFFGPRENQKIRWNIRFAPALQRLLIKTRFQNAQWILKLIFWRPANLNMKVLKTWNFKNGVSENQ